MARWLGREQQNFGFMTRQATCYTSHVRAALLEDSEDFPIDGQAETGGVRLPHPQMEEEPVGAVVSLLFISLYLSP